MLPNEKIEYDTIESLVKENSTVLDLGCGSGELMEILTDKKKARCQGIEIDEEKVYACVRRGLSVFLGDLDSGLEDYEDQTFDYVILNHSLQELKEPDEVLQDAFRVGKKVIVGIPNFAYYRSRALLCFRGVAPHAPSQPQPWYETPNLTVITIKDFLTYIKTKNYKILKEYYFNNSRRIQLWPNIFATRALFVLERR